MTSRVSAAFHSFVSPDVRAGLSRFPLAAAFAALLTALVVLEQYDSPLVEGLTDRAFTGTAALGLAALAAGLFAEGRGWPLAGRLAAQAIVLVPLALLHLAPPPWRMEDEFLLPGLVLAISVAGYLRGGASTDAFWRFNERLWLSAGLALLSAGVFALGIFVIDRSLDVLFGIDFEELVLNIVVPAAFCLLAPLMWLSSVPSLQGAASLEPDHFLDRAVRLIARFILVPLLFVYALILFVYTVQILVLGELPQGQVGWMVSAFGTAGAATVLLLHPERETGGRLVRTFLRWWFPVTIVPVGLLAAAVWERLSAYGLTPERYALVLVTLWLAAMAALFSWRRTPERDIRVVPGLLAALLVAGSFGPWGAEAVTVRSQLAQFVALGENEGWIEAGRIDEAALREAIGAPGERPQPRASHLLSYLAGADALPRLRARLENPGALALFARDTPHLRDTLAGALGIDPADMPARPLPLVLEPRDEPVDLSGYAVMVGPLQVSSDPSAGNAAGAIDGAALTVALPDGRSLRFDLSAAIAEPDAEAAAASLPAFLTAPQEDGSTAGLLLLEVTGAWTPDALHLRSARVVAMAGEGS